MFLNVSSPQNRNSLHSFDISYHGNQTCVYSENDVLIFCEVFTNESEPVVGDESVKGLDERERGSAVLEAPRPPNSQLSISAAVRPLGLRLPPTRGGGEPPQGKKNTTKQMQRAAGQCVCMYVCVTFLHACGFLKLRMRASAYVFVCCV